MSTVKIHISKKNFKKNKRNLILTQIAARIREDLNANLPIIKFKVSAHMLAMDTNTIHIKWNWSLPVEKNEITNIIKNFGKKQGGFIDHIFYDDSESDRFVSPNI